jgi:hypothetical protein
MKIKPTCKESEATLTHTKLSRLSRPNQAFRRQFEPGCFLSGMAVNLSQFRGSIQLFQGANRCGTQKIATRASQTLIHAILPSEQKSL